MRLIKNSALLLLLLLSVGVFLEILFRTSIFPTNLPFKVREKTKVQKTYVNGIKQLIPNQTIYAVDKANGTVKKEFVKYQINCWGYSGKDFLMQKSKDELRVVILGGSHIFDINAFVSEGINGFHQIVIDSFQAIGVNLNFINAGVHGQDIKNISARLTHEIPALKPDIVIINSTYNDLRWIPANDTVLLLERVVDLNNSFQLNPLSDTLGFNPLESRYSRLDIYCGQSNLYRRVRDLYWLSRVMLWQKKYNDYINKQVKLNMKDKGFESYRSLLMQSISQIRKMGAIPVLCIEERLMKANPTPEMLKVHTPSWFPYQSTYDTIVADYEKADSIISAVAVSNNIVLFNANKYLGGNKEMFSDNIHTSSLGSIKMGQEYYRLLLPLIQDSLLHKKN